MIRTLIDLLSFFNSLSGFLFALIFWTIVTILFSKSIKKYAHTLYWIFGIFGVMTLLPILNVFGIKMMNVIYIPLLGDLLIEFTYATYFIHPILFIIMYMGAFSPKISCVGKLMTIRKELSIIVGFAVIPHAIKRILTIVPHAWTYFADHDELVKNNQVVSELGQGISNGVFLLGVIMTFLFLILWITSFGAVHKKLGSRRWKKVQRWSYALYAMLFIHSVGMDAGSLIRQIEQEQSTHKEIRINVSSQSGNSLANKDSQIQASFLGMSMKQETKQKGGHHDFSGKFKLSNVQFSPMCKSIVNIFILVVLYGSYLFFRLKKAQTDKYTKHLNNN